MRKKIDAQPEIIFSSADDLAWAKRVSRLAESGAIRLIRAGVYTSNLTLPLESIVLRNWRLIAEHLFPGAVIGLRSAVKGMPENGKLFLVREGRASRVRIPGLEFVLVPGAKPLREGLAPDIPYGRLFVSSEPRRCLENLSKSKGAKERATGRDLVEADLERILAISGEAGLNKLRDMAREIAPVLGLESEFAEMNRIVGALLSTHDAAILQTKQGRARAQGAPIDSRRIALIDTLFSMLNSSAFPHIHDPAQDLDAKERFAFFEAYFSNFIEGTQFTIEEAEDIVFHGRVIENRSEDSRDIAGTFDAIVSEPSRASPPDDPPELMEWLKHINRLVMQAHPSKRPGEFKEKQNQAGSTLFVAPDMVPGTLAEGALRVRSLADPVARAMMMMFVITEVHPFADGNGRTARIAMNAVLSRAGLVRIIIPTLYREDYIAALKALSHNSDTPPYIAMLSKAQEWSAAFNWSADLPEVIRMMRQCNAFETDASQFKLDFPDAPAKYKRMKR